MIRRVLPIEECAWSLTAIRTRSYGPRPSRRRAVSRATTSADRFPAEPPVTKQPPAPAGSPARSASSRSTWFSAAIAPAASSQEMPCSEAQETTMSNSSAALVGAAGMKDEEARAVAGDHRRGQVVGVHRQHLSRVVPLGAEQPGQHRVQLRPVARVVQRHRVELEPVPHVVEDQVGEALVVGVHPVGRF